MEQIKSILRAILSHIKAWWYNPSVVALYGKIEPFMPYLAAFIATVFILLGFGGCSSVKYVPMQSETKVVVRDSIVRVVDTVKVEVPVEVVKEIVPQDTVSVLKTSLAESEAKIEKGQLHHNLKQSGTVKVRIDTCYITKIEERVVYQDRPVEVVKEVRYIPKWAWFCLIFTLCWFVWKVARFLKA